MLPSSFARPRRVEQPVPTALPEVTAEQTLELQPSPSSTAGGQAGAGGSAAFRAAGRSPQTDFQRGQTSRRLSSSMTAHSRTCAAVYRLIWRRLGTVSGVGEAKLAKYGARFLEVIREYLTQGKEG